MAGEGTKMAKGARRTFTPQFNAEVAPVPESPWSKSPRI